MGGWHAKQGARENRCPHLASVTGDVGCYALNTTHSGEFHTVKKSLISGWQEIKNDEYPWKNFINRELRKCFNSMD